MKKDGRKKRKVDAQSRPGAGGVSAEGAPITDERRRLAELEREHRELKMENELLRRWVEFASKEPSK